MCKSEMNHYEILKQEGTVFRDVLRNSNFLFVIVTKKNKKENENRKYR